MTVFQYLVLRVSLINYYSLITSPPSAYLIHPISPDIYHVLASIYLPDLLLNHSNSALKSQQLDLVDMKQDLTKCGKIILL